MSMSDVSTRFADIMNRQDNYHSVSLPLLTDDDEVIFFYYASLLPDGFVLEEVGDVAFRDLQTSVIRVKEPSEFFSNEELEQLTSHQPVKGLKGTEALKYVNTYYDLHEEVLRLGIGKADDELLRLYIGTFSRIIPKSGLRKVYYRIGKPMFQQIARRVGKQLEP